MRNNFEIIGPYIDPRSADQRPADQRFADQRFADQRPAAACDAVLHDLPEWFGIESAVQQYITDAASLPTWIAEADQCPVGFLTVKQHTPYAAEVWVTGVLRAYHRAGIGRALLAAAEDWLRAQGVEYLQVKTLAPSDPDPNYARTRAFYRSTGFRPLEETSALWGPENPCLILIKRL